MTDTSEEKIYVKVPTFNGTKSKWPAFKSKFTSYLAQKGMEEMLDDPDIEKDTKTWTNDEKKQDDVKKKIKLRDMNYCG